MVVLTVLPPGGRGYCFSRKGSKERGVEIEYEEEVVEEDGG